MSSSSSSAPSSGAVDSSKPAAPALYQRTDDFPHSFSEYRILGNNCGLRVSPLCLGTMTMGSKWQFLGSADFAETERIFDHAVSNGLNFIDTANKYQDSETETWLGEIMKKRNIRDDIVLASKYSLPAPQAHKIQINYAGNQRKCAFEAVDASLKRLQTSYLDILYVHFSDLCTPAMEIVRLLDDLVRSGRVHHVAVSDMPAWEAAVLQTVASYQHVVPLVAYQGRYNIGDRTMERDILPMAKRMGMAVCPWGVLGAGKYTGKLSKDHPEVKASRAGVNMTDRDWKISDALVEVAKEIGNVTPSQVALNYILGSDGCIVPVVGCKSVAQLDESMKAISFSLTAAQRKKLDTVSAFDLGFPGDFIGTSAPSNPWLKSAGKIWAPSPMP